MNQFCRSSIVRRKKPDFDPVKWASAAAIVVDALTRFAVAAGWL